MCRTQADVEPQRAQILMTLKGLRARRPRKEISHEIPFQDDLQIAKRTKAGEGLMVLLGNQTLNTPSTAKP